MADTNTQNITVKYRLYPSDVMPFVAVSETYRDACNFVSEYVSSIHSDDNIDLPSFRNLHDSLYYRMRDMFRLSAQMTQSVMRTVLARYSTLVTQIRNSEKAAEAWDGRAAELAEKGRKPKTKRPKVIAWTRIRFRALQCDQLADRDWSIKVPSENGGRCDYKTLN